MFVDTQKRITIAIIGITSLLTACVSSHKPEMGSLNVNLSGVEAGGGPLYVSVQKRDDFMQKRGTSGGIYKQVMAGNLSYEYEKIPVGDYSVMIWHDTNNDGVFTMDETTHMPLDGWGTSGPETKGQPKFDDVKIAIPAAGTAVTINMHYPK